MKLKKLSIISAISLAGLIGIVHSSNAEIKERVWSKHNVQGSWVIRQSHDKFTNIKGCWGNFQGYEYAKRSSPHLRGSSLIIPLNYSHVNDFFVDERKLVDVNELPSVFIRYDNEAIIHSSSNDTFVESSSIVKSLLIPRWKWDQHEKIDIRFDNRYSGIGRSDITIDLKELRKYLKSYDRCQQNIENTKKVHNWLKNF